MSRRNTNTKGSLQPPASSLQPGDRLIVALDHPTAAQALRIAKRLRGCIRTVKVGSILFTACGPTILRQLRALGFEVMLDLKFFDIPSTVERSCRAAAGHRVSLLTVHAAGGRSMLEAAVRGAREEARRLRAPRPGVLGVTVLTSMDGAVDVKRRVLALACAARAAGCDGVVASAQEAAALRRRFRRALRIACPGIRSAAAALQDQQRVSTPGEALAHGADWLIVGRPITEARNPRAAAQRILHDMEGATRC